MYTPTLSLNLSSPPFASSSFPAPPLNVPSGVYGFTGSQSASQSQFGYSLSQSPRARTQAAEVNEALYSLDRVLQGKCGAWKSMKAAVYSRRSSSKLNTKLLLYEYYFYFFYIFFFYIFIIYLILFLFYLFFILFFYIHFLFIFVYYFFYMIYLLYYSSTFLNEIKDLKNAFQKKRKLQLHHKFIKLILIMVLSFRPCQLISYMISELNFNVFFSL